jgi:hypothetical protein
MGQTHDGKRERPWHEKLYERWRHESLVFCGANSRFLPVVAVKNSSLWIDAIGKDLPKVTNLLHF